MLICNYQVFLKIANFVANIFNKTDIKYVKSYCFIIDCMIFREIEGLILRFYF